MDTTTVLFMIARCDKENLFQHFMNLGKGRNATHGLNENSTGVKVMFKEQLLKTNFNTRLDADNF